MMMMADGVMMMMMMMMMIRLDEKSALVGVAALAILHFTKLPLQKATLPVQVAVVAQETQDPRIPKQDRQHLKTAAVALRRMTGPGSYLITWRVAMLS